MPFEIRNSRHVRDHEPAPPLCERCGVAPATEHLARRRVELGVDLGTVSIGWYCVPCRDLAREDAEDESS